jgi:gliding motility-associated-like protein
MSKNTFAHITLITKYLFKYFFLILISCIIYKKTNAQQFNNWVFLNNNGLSFNTNPPSFFGGGQMSNLLGGYSCASISNANGQLLFYSDGERVWNKNNVLMPNGFGLFGGEGQINTALIVPFINDSSKYYLFVSKGLTFHNAGDEVNYNYSFNVIDMNLNGGLGDVVNKNVIIRNFATEKMVAIPNANGNDIWWVCRDWTNNFYSYKITCAGFQNNNPVISTVGSNINNDGNLLSSGEIKASPNGKYICVSYGSYFELYQFNNNTGVLSSPILISTLSSYGVEFSPDNKFVYITGVEQNNGNGVFIKQYSLNNYNVAAIIASAYLVDSLTGNGGLQLGPDNKIYNNGGGEAVDVINNPNIQGVGCNFQDSIIVLPNGGYRRFPYSYVNLITAQNVQATCTVAADCRTVTFTGKTYIKGNNLTFKWKWGEPPPVGGTLADSATQVVASQGDTTITTITHVYPPGIDTFFVNLSVTSDTVCGTGRAGIKVIVKPPKPKANFGFATTCNNLNVVFTDSSLLNFNPSLTYTYAYKPALAPAMAYANFSTQPNNNFTFATYDSFDIRLVVKSNLSCVTNDTIIKRIVLKAKPVAGFGYTNNCGSLQVAFTSSANITAGSIVLQQYFVGNTLIGTDANISYNFASYGSYQIKHVVKSNVGCVSDTFYNTIVVKDKPTLNLTTARDSVCANTNYTIAANANVNASTITNYTWFKNGNLLSITNNQLTDNAAAASANIYKVITTAATGCKSDTGTKIITVASKPVTTLNANNNCGSKAINITSTAPVVNDNIVNYFISYGDGITNTINPSNTTYTYTNYGTYTLKYVVKGSVGCTSDTAYFTIEVKDKPTLNLFSFRDSVCANTNYTITANANVNGSTITNYTWLRNNTVLPNTTNQLTENQTTNTYIYKAITTAANGCKSDTAYKTITVASKPITTLNATNICGSKIINITSTAPVVNDVITNYYVNYGDGITSNTNPSNTTHTYTNYGTYTLKYVAKGSVGCTSDTAYFTIVVKDKPTLSIAYYNDACNNKNFTLTATAGVTASTITNYTWLRNNTVLPNTNTQLTDNQPTNNYTYKVIATANTGCTSDTAFQNLAVENFNTTLFTAANGCLGKLIVLTNTSINNNPLRAITYTWLTSDGQTSSALLPNFSFANSGTKTIQLKTNTQNNCADSIAKTITVDDFPIADFNITEACLGKKLTIVNNTTGASVYNWSTSNGQTDNNILPNFIFNNIGNYNVKLTVATANNCTNDIEKNISIQAVQLFTTPAIDTNGVVNQAVQLFVAGATNYSWQWAVGNMQGGSLQFANSNAPIFTGNTIGIYPIQVEGTTAQGCKGTASIKINVFAANNYVWIPNAFTPNGDGLNDKIKITCSGLQSLTNFTLYNRYGEMVYQQNTCNNSGWDGIYKGKAQSMSAFVYYWSGVNFKGKVVSGKGTVMLVR